MNPRTVLRVLIPLAVTLSFGQEAMNPWPDSAVLQAADFAKSLESGGKAPTIISVAFPVLYNTRHIKGAVFAGPGRDPAGIESLKKTVASLPKNADIVLYCGCCPMKQCPNIRPAFRTLKEMGFTHVRIVDIPTNMATDWYGKNYPSETGPLGK